MSPYILEDLSIISEILPVVVSWFYFSRMTQSLKVFAYTLLVSSFFTILNVYLGLHRIHNLWALNLFMPIQFGLVTYFLSFYFGNLLRRVILWFIPGFFVLWSIDFLLFESIFKFSAYAKPVECLLLTLIASFSFIRNYRSNLLPPASDPLFWIASGIMLYYSSTAIAFSISTILLSLSSEALRIVFSAQATVNAIVNMLYTSGILCLRQQPRYSGQS